MPEQFQMSQEARNTLIKNIEIKIEELHDISNKGISFKEVSLDIYEELFKKAELLSIYLEDLTNDFNKTGETK